MEANDGSAEKPVAPRPVKSEYFMSLTKLIATALKELESIVCQNKAKQ